MGDWNAVGVTAEVVYLDQTALFADISEPPKKKQVLPFDAVLCPGDPSRFGNDPGAPDAPARHRRGASRS